METKTKKQKKTKQKFRLDRNDRNKLEKENIKKKMRKRLILLK